MLHWNLFQNLGRLLWLSVPTVRGLTSSTNDANKRDTLNKSQTTVCKGLTVRSETMQLTGAVQACFSTHSLRMQHPSASPAMQEKTRATMECNKTLPYLLLQTRSRRQFAAGTPEQHRQGKALQSQMSPAGVGRHFVGHPEFAATGKL